MTVGELLLSLFFVLLYSVIWMLLEVIQYGMIINRNIDNEIMLLLYPMFLLSAKYMLNKYHK